MKHTLKYLLFTLVVGMLAVGCGSSSNHVDDYSYIPNQNLGSIRVVIQNDSLIGMFPKTLSQAVEINPNVVEFQLFVYGHNGTVIDSTTVLNTFGNDIDVIFSGLPVESSSVVLAGVDNDDEVVAAYAATGIMPLPNPYQLINANAFFPINDYELPTP